MNQVKPTMEINACKRLKRCECHYNWMSPSRAIAYLTVEGEHRGISKLSLRHNFTTFCISTVLIYEKLVHPVGKYSEHYQGNVKLTLLSDKIQRKIGLFQSIET